MKLLTADELAARWGVPKSWVYAKARTNPPEIPVVQLGRYRRFRLEDVERFEREGGTGAAA